MWSLKCHLISLAYWGKCSSQASGNILGRKRAWKFKQNLTMKLHMKLFYFVGVVLIPVPINAETSHLSTESICQYSSIILSNLSDICCFSFQEVPAHQWFSTRMATLRDDTISSSTRTPTGPQRSTESSALGPISSTSEWDFKHTHTHTEVGEWVKSQKLTSSGLFARSWSLSVSTFYNFH